MRARLFGGTNVDAVQGIDADPSLRIAVTGRFGNTVDFGLGTGVATGSLDAFLVQFRGTSAPNWVVTFGGPETMKGCRPPSRIALEP